MSLFVPEGTRASAMLRGSGVRGSRLVRCMIEPVSGRGGDGPLSTEGRRAFVSASFPIGFYRGAVAPPRRG